MLRSLLMALPWRLSKQNQTGAQIMLKCPTRRFCCMVWFCSQLATRLLGKHRPLRAEFAFSADGLPWQKSARAEAAVTEGAFSPCPTEAAQQLAGHRAVFISGSAEDAGAMLFKNALLGFLFQEDPQQGLAALPWGGHCFWSRAMQLMGLHTRGLVHPVLHQLESTKPHVPVPLIASLTALYRRSSS